MMRVYVLIYALASIPYVSSYVNNRVASVTFPAVHPFRQRNLISLNYKDGDEKASFERGSGSSNSGAYSSYSLNCGSPGSSRPLHMVASMAANPINGAILDTPVHNFQSPAQYLEALDANHEDNELLVVKYYASYCKICQRASISFKKIAMDRNDKPVRFARLESSRMPADLLRQLGLTKFPFVQIFRHGKIVASFSTGPSHMFAPKVRNTVDTCLQRSEEEWAELEKEFGHEIQANLEAREALRKYCTGIQTEER